MLGRLRPFAVAAALLVVAGLLPGGRAPLVAARGVLSSSNCPRFLSGESLFTGRAAADDLTKDTCYLVNVEGTPATENDTRIRCKPNGCKGACVMQRQPKAGGPFENDPNTPNKNDGSFERQDEYNYRCSCQVARATGSGLNFPTAIPVHVGPIVPGGHEPSIGPPGSMSPPPKNATSASNGSTLLDNTNPNGVQNAPPAQTQFILPRQSKITAVMTYHWNNGAGAVPGTIALRALNGTVYGPYPVTGSSGQNNAANVNWTAHPNISLAAGTYTIIDSNRATWSWNTQSRTGFARVLGLTP